MTVAQAGVDAVLVVDDNAEGDFISADLVDVVAVLFSN